MYSEAFGFRQRITADDDIEGVLEVITIERELAETIDVVVEETALNTYAFRLRLDLLSASGLTNRSANGRVDFLGRSI